MMKKKILITVGGTGGHIYPALALATQLKGDFEVCFVGGNLKNNPFFSRHGFPYHTISCATLSGKNPLRYFKSGMQIMVGVGQSLRLIKRFKPDVIVGFGSYYTFPTLLAAKLAKVPIVLHEANSIPGKVNRLMAPFVKVTGVHFPETKIKGKTAVVGMPVRKEFRPSAEKQELAFRYYGLDPKKQTILVFGGSQGAHAINKTFMEAAIHLEDVQILHITGNRDLAKDTYKNLGLYAVVKEFEARMDLAWSVADLVISRAGASTIAEQREFCVPAIFIPYPYATDKHQDKNADFVARQVQGAVKLQEAELTPRKLVETIQTIDLKAMREALKKHHQESSLATLIREQV